MTTHRHYPGVIRASIRTPGGSMSETNGISWGPLQVACPKCGAAAGHRCRTTTTGRVTDTHIARWEADQ